jgi:hypothetical protein
MLLPDHFGAFRYPMGAGKVQRPSSSAARIPARVRSERTSLSNCANDASTPSINLPVDVSSIGSVADPALACPAVLQQVLKLTAVRGLGALAFLVEPFEDLVALAAAMP